jgi:hypothetical protein
MDDVDRRCCCGWCSIDGDGWEMGDGNKTKASSLSLSLEWGPRARDHSLLPGIPGRLLAAWLLHIPLALDAPTFIS